MAVIDRDSATGSIDDTNTHQLVVSASQADYVWCLIDDGTSGTAPSSYDFKVEGYSPSTEEDKFKFAWEETGVTERSWTFPAVGSKTRITITNQSGGSAQYDATAESRSESE